MRRRTEGSDRAAGGLVRASALALGVLAGMSAAGATEAACEFRGWSRDPDPAGLNLRAAPSSTAAVVGRLPAPRREGDETFAVEMHVVAGRDGWLLVDRAEFADYGSAPAKTVFTGRGWVSGRMVGVSVQDERVRRQPDAAAAIIDRPRVSAGGEAEILRLERIVGCRGRWIEVEGSFGDASGEAGRGPGRPTRGWVTGLCGNQVTTCP